MDFRGAGLICGAGKFASVLRRKRPAVPLAGVAVAALCVGLSGCGSDPTRFADIATDIASKPSANAAERAYADNFAALIARDGHERLIKANGLGPERKSADLTTTLREAERTLTRLERPAFEEAPPRLSRVVARSGGQFDTRWRDARSTLYLAPAGPGTSGEPFAFSSLQARSTEIALVSLQNRPYRLTMNCDAPMTVDGKSGIAIHRQGAPFTVADDAPSPDAQQILLRPSPQLTRCEATARFAGGGSRQFRIVREEDVNPSLAALDSRFDACALPDEDRLTPLQRAFYSGRWLSETCPFRPGRIDILASEEDGFNAKVEALLGKRLSPAFIKRGNPESPIDFSRAPRLSLVYASYLDFKADFSGRVMTRLLGYHADRGTTVRIIVSDVLTRDKDRAQLEALAADHHNVQLKIFRWKPPAGVQPTEALSQFHKVHHVKMLTALSTEPGRSVAIIGGRNIHDGFLFNRPLNLSSFPELQQYGRKRGLTLNYYSNWRDIDIAVRGDQAARTLAAHMSTMWNDDAETSMFRPLAVFERGGTVPQGAVARHFLSAPYDDRRALESYYAELIDAASRTIEIINPYINLTPAIEAAFRRALDRGVAITLIGRIDMAGDLGGAALTALNSQFVAGHADRIAIYDFKDPAFLLHGKVLMIDGKLTVVSSVNLNNRSFIHDSENGMAIMDEGFYRRMKEVFEDYRSKSVRVETARVPLFWRLLFKIRTLREAL